MNVVLQEKAESQQSLSLLRREHEELQNNAQETVARLAALQEEVDLRNREYTEMQKRTAELTADLEAARTEYESRLSEAGEDLAEARQQRIAATEDLEASQRAGQEETDSLRRELEALRRQHEEDVRFLEEQLELSTADFESERERLLLLQDELAEQLALKEGFLQDVQEEEEDASRAPAPPQHSPDHSDQLRAALEDLQAHNMMLQEELVLLRNLKLQLESEMKQTRDDFAVEKEELEFRVNEMQMNRDASVERSGAQTSDKSPSADPRVTDQEDLRDRAERLVKELQSVFQQIRGAEETSEEEGLEVTVEDLRNENEETLESLQHKESLVHELKEMLKSVVFSESDLNQNRTLSEENEEHMKTLEEDSGVLQAQQQDTVRDLQARITSQSEERDALQRDVERLSAAQRRIVEILQHSSSETEVDGASDVSNLVERLWTQAQEERHVLQQRLEEAAEEREARVHELQREKDLLRASLEDVLLDAEGLQKDLRDMQAMNEKLREENHRLLSLEEKGQESQEESDEADRDALISQLREEVAHLQMCKESSVSDENEQMIALSHEIEMLKKESKEKDERMNKIKAVAVKAKKELDNSKKEVFALREEVEQLKAERDALSRSVKDIIHGAEDYKNLMLDYDKQTELLDQEREKLEQASKHNEDLTRRLQNAVQQHELLSSEREDLTARVETLQRNTTQLEAQVLETQKLKSALERDLEAERLLREQKTKEHQSAVREVEELQTQLSRHRQQLQQTDQELEQLRKDAQQSTLLDMEMADYEKLVKELNHQLCEKDKQAEEQEALVQTLREREQRLSQEMESLKLLLEQTEDKASRMKQLLVKTKKDLADAKQKEAVQLISQSALRGDLEAHQQQLEELKIQSSELTAERHRLQEQLKLMGEQQQRASSSYQLSLSALQDECTAAKADLAATLSEFESYKVRVHNVLKQQKHKSSSQSDGDAFRLERERSEAVLEQLRSRLQETQQSLTSSASELQQLQTEHDMLLERHNKILQETVSREAELRERLLALQSESLSLRSEHGQCASHLSAQTEALRGGFREQMRQLQEEHCGTLETLQQQIRGLEAQLFQLQREPSGAGAALAPQSRRRPADVPPLELQGMAREEGEGMETTETESLSSSSTPLASLEQLLTSADLKHEPAVWHMEPSKEELSQKLSTAARSVEHLSSLLHETEATNAVLMEQITLLKSELRRLERNQEREKSVASLEYLKNVLLQFIFLRSGSERQALLPVIHTLLQLSPEEKGKLAAIAHGEESAAVSRGSGWTSYLHSWSGIR
ncbi:GRIP and coiled-coil domain-containing protein 2 isoform X2 [Puntigrus tetrazona]|nr:GRIP and coiled-coil domain-containing protein 2 isoform X2 [Puntigrus tetrazona]